MSETTGARELVLNEAVGLQTHLGGRSVKGTAVPLAVSMTSSRVLAPAELKSAGANACVSAWTDHTASQVSFPSNNASESFSCALGAWLAEIRRLE